MLYKSEKEIRNLVFNILNIEYCNSYITTPFLLDWAAVTVFREKIDNELTNELRNIIKYFYEKGKLPLYDS